MVEPILKWAGGKRQILDSILEAFPKNYTNYRYHEPMFGGGAVFFEVEPSSGSINDYNTKLVNFYKQVRDNPEEIIEQLESYKHPEEEPDETREYSEKNRKGKDIKNYYYQQRELFNKRPNNEKYDEVKEAALLLYLNRTCYNGLYRENQSGEFNTPIGQYKNPDWVREKQIRQASKVLQGVQIYNQDFEYILSKVSSSTKDIIYFDPPYKPLSDTADFTSYTSDDFGREDQNRLIETINKLSEIPNTEIVVSNSGVMRKRYEEETDLSVRSIDAKRSISSDGETRGDVKEILAHTK